MLTDQEKVKAKAALDLAVKVAGSQSKLGRQLGKRQSHVASWIARGWPPAEVVRSIEARTGVAKELLRPDLWGAE